MPARLSNVLGVSTNALDAAGVFDAFVDIDSSLHIDPHLLASSAHAEMREADITLKRHFVDIITILRHARTDADVFLREAAKRLTFPEDRLAALGYSKGSVAGTGISPELAAAIASTARQIVAAGVTDPEIFELVGLLQEDVGADRISDMVFGITRAHFLAFTQRIAASLGVGAVDVRIADVAYRLPRSPRSGNVIVLFPKDVLRQLPIALDWNSKDLVCRYNEELRERVNNLIGTTWRQARQVVTKAKLREVVTKYPASLGDAINQYKAKPASPYDFETDKNGEILWLETSRDYATQHPLQFANLEQEPSRRLVQVVRAIVDQFARLVEMNGLWRLLIDRNEKMSQLTFYGIADSYCCANNLDVSPEVNSGRGPVDFKFSSGYGGRAIVEVKLSSNTKLRHGYTVQVEEYRKAERSVFEVFLVVQTGATTKQLSDVREMYEAAVRTRKSAPELRVVDARPKEAASKY